MIRSVVIESTIFSKVPCYYRDCASAPGARLKPAVRCNSVRPAFIEGPMADDMIGQFRDPARARERLSASVPLGRFDTPAEVAALCVYLLSDESAFVTSAELVLDGGLTAQ